MRQTLSLILFMFIFAVVHNIVGVLDMFFGFNLGYAIIVTGSICSIFAIRAIIMMFLNKD